MNELQDRIALVTGASRGLGRAIAIAFAREGAGLALTHLDVAAARDDLRVCGAYELDGERVERLPPGPAGDLDRQAALTRRLLRARPVYDRVACGWVGTVAGALGVPVALGSFGPTAADKRGAGPLRSQDSPLVLNPPIPA